MHADQVKLGANLAYGRKGKGGGSTGSDAEFRGSQGPGGGYTTPLLGANPRKLVDLDRGVVSPPNEQQRSLHPSTFYK